MTFYLLSEQIVDPESGEVLGRSGEENPERLMDYLEMYPAFDPDAPGGSNRPQWLSEALCSCYQGSSSFLTNGEEIT